MRRYNYILTNENTSEVKTLTNAPAGWEERTELNARSMTYNGVIMSETLPLRFVKTDGGLDGGGYQFIIDAFDADGIQALIKIEIQEYNGYTNDYDDDFEGYLDFDPLKEFIDNISEEYVSLPIKDSRKSAKLIARDEIEYNLFSTTSTDGTTVTDFASSYNDIDFLPVNIFLNNTTSGQFSGNGTTTDVNLYVYNNYAGTTEINEIGNRMSINSPAVDELIYTNTLDYNTEFFCTTTNGNVQDTINITGSGGGAWTYRKTVIYTIYDDSDIFQKTIEKIILDKSGTGDETNLTYTDSYSYSFLEETLQPGWYITMQTECWLVSAGEKTLQARTVVDNMIYYEKTNGESASNIRGFFAHEALSRIIQLATDETDTSKLINSPVFGRTDSEFTTYASNGDWGYLFLTNGFQLRELTSRAINASFRDLFKGLNAIDPLGMWYDSINDYFYIDTIDNFYKLEAFANDLGEVADLKIYPAKELYYNKLLTGNPKTENEDFQGANEFNTQTEHFVNLELKKDFSIRSTYRTSTIDMELARRLNKRGYVSEDSKYDENNYLVVTDGDETIQGEVADMDGFEGIEEYYNQTITPKMNAQRWWKIISAAIYKALPGELIKYLKASKDNNITYTDPEKGVSTNEQDDITESGLQERLIDPVMYEFNAPYTKAIRDELKADPHRYFEFTDRNNTQRYGYVWEISGKPYREQATYKLIALNENRLP
jgi:hypothetical protein